MSEHTKEPWKFESEENPLDHEMDFFITDAAGINQVCKVDISEANARRIVACVNACAGLSTENLEANRPMKWLAEQYNATVKQHNKLLTALLDVINAPNDDAVGSTAERIRAYAAAEKLIAEIEAAK